MDKDKEALEIFLNGRIDEDNVGEVETSIEEMISVNPHSTLKIDMSDVESVTDDGLKALKSLGEKSKNVELTNVTDSIYEVFEKFGITSVMPVRKRMELEV